MKFEKVIFNDVSNFHNKRLSPVFGWEVEKETDGICPLQTETGCADEVRTETGCEDEVRMVGSCCKASFPPK
jgi:hypothetical protein